MEEDQEARHVCKVCGKSFPCGRSLGGHRRSHPGISPASDHRKTGDKLHKKKLPDGESEGEIVCGAKENPNRIRKFSETNGGDTFLDQEKSCKECGKSFQSFKALFGHMKCHSMSRRATEEDFQKQVVMDRQSDNEAATSICRRKRSNRTRRSRAADTTNSSSDIAVAVCEINDQLEKEEVALSLILLSMNRGSANSAVVVKSSSGSSEFIEAKRDDHNDLLKFKKIQAKSPQVPAVGLNSEVAKKNLAIQCNDLSKIRSKRKCIDDHNLANSPSDSVQDYEKKGKFICTICLNAFPSYQALGVHRANHKKFKSCCANQNDFNIAGVPTENIKIGAMRTNSKQHECPICFRVFASGQALGGHKRSHLITEKPKTVTDSSIFIMQKPITEVRRFLDLNMPAPVEEECIELKPWWIKDSHRLENEPLLSFL